jgi:hypothetical protein
MLNDQELARSLRAALPRLDESTPARDLWPLIVERATRKPRWSAADWSAAAIIVIGLLLFPEWFWFLAYHL